MEITVTYLLLVLVGLCLGSFAGAMVWRLRARQLAEDRSRHQVYDHEEYTRLSKLIHTSTVADRSRCLHCSYTLRWYDLIPVLSWVSLKGRCRKCHHRIGRFEPLMEIGVVLFFVLSYALWPYPLETALEIAHLFVWLGAGIGLAILFAYDAKWLLLPDKVSFGVIGLGALMSVLVLLQAEDLIGAVLSIVTGAVILSGIYLLLYFISRGKWIGLGDIKLGLGLALLLADWRLAFIALFAANLVGTLVVLPQMLRGKLERTAHVPFGPLLIVGTVIAQLAGFYFIDTYTYGIF